MCVKRCGASGRHSTDGFARAASIYCCSWRRWPAACVMTHDCLAQQQPIPHSAAGCLHMRCCSLHWKLLQLGSSAVAAGSHCVSMLTGQQHKSTTAAASALKGLSAASQAWPAPPGSVLSVLWLTDSTSSSVSCPISGGRLVSLLWFSRKTLRLPSCPMLAGSATRPQLLRFRFLTDAHCVGASTQVAQKCPKPSQLRSFHTPDRSTCCRRAVSSDSEGLPDPLVCVKCMLRSTGGLLATLSCTIRRGCGKVAAFGMGSNSRCSTTVSCKCCSSSLHER